jgi:phosphatase NudJ
MPRKPVPTWYVAAVVVRHGDRFLLVQERKRGAPWALPGGRVEPGETLMDAAVRETLEESGVRVRLTGLLRLEHTPRPRRARLRAVFLGEPEGDTTTKREPDKESLGAAWVTLDELGHYALRSREIEKLLRRVADDGRAYPLDLLARRGTMHLTPRDLPNAEIVRRPRDSSLRSFVIRGVCTFGVPTAVLATATVFLQIAPHAWRDLVSMKFVVAVLLGVIPAAVFWGGLYGWVMWKVFARRRG